MTDLDEAVRHHLSQIVDTAPMAPSFQSIEARSQTQPRPGIRWQAAAGGIAALGATVWLAITLLAPTVSEIEAADESAIRFGPPVLLDLPEVVNTKLMLATSGDDLLTGNSFGTNESWQLEITRTQAHNPQPETLLQIPTGGILMSLDVSGDVVLAVVSQHTTEKPPLAVISTDGGETWGQHELPPSNAEDPEQHASNGGAIGDDGFAIVGTNGVWTSDNGTAWQFTQLITIDRAKPVWEQDWLTSIVWDGISFVVAGGIDDSLAGDSGDADIAFWRSVDGQEWGLPQVVITDAAIRTSDGVGHITTNGDGTVVAMTATQQWRNGSVDGLDRGTLIAVSTEGQPFAATHLSDWILYDTFTTRWGFVAAGTKENRPTEPRLLLSADGRSWGDIGPAPGMSAAGVQWLEGIVINGPVAESGNPNLTWRLLADPNGPAPSSLAPTATGPPQGPDQVVTTQNLGPPLLPDEDSD